MASLKLGAILLWSLTAATLMNILVAHPGQEDDTLVGSGEKEQHSNTEQEQVKDEEVDEMTDQESKMEKMLEFTRKTSYKWTIMIAFTVLSLTVGFFLLLVLCPPVCRQGEEFMPRRYLDTKLRTGDLWRDKNYMDFNPGGVWRIYNFSAAASASEV